MLEQTLPGSSLAFFRAYILSILVRTMKIFITRRVDLVLTSREANSPCVSTPSRAAVVLVTVLLVDAAQCCVAMQHRTRLA